MKALTSGAGPEECLRSAPWEEWMVQTVLVLP